jgi:beta-lactam-binding protein with PASTA domain
MWVLVPDVIGKSYADARATLKAQHLNVGRVTNDPTSKASPCTVLTQRPTANTRVLSDSTVDLTVKENRVPVPNVVGMASQDEVTALVTHNLKVGTVTGDLAASRSIASQDPEA